MELSETGIEPKRFRNQSHPVMFESSGSRFGMDSLDAHTGTVEADKAESLTGHGRR